MSCMCYFVLCQLKLGRILKAQVALRGLIIEWVNVRGFEEENIDESKVCIHYIELQFKFDFRKYRFIGSGLSAS